VFSTRSASAWLASSGSVGDAWGAVTSTTACSIAAMSRSVSHIGQMRTSSRTRAPQVGQLRASRLRSTAISVARLAEGRTPLLFALLLVERNGCSQIEQLLAVRETGAPQYGQVRFPLSCAVTIPVSCFLRLGVGRLAPHIKQVRAESLTSALHSGQRRFLPGARNLFNQGKDGKTVPFVVHPNVQVCTAFLSVHQSSI
jgi:hypothetical protein